MISFSASSSMAKSTDSSFTNTILIYACVCICVGDCVKEDWIPLELEFTGNCEQLRIKLCSLEITVSALSIGPFIMFLPWDSGF